MERPTVRRSQYAKPVIYDATSSAIFFNSIMKPLPPVKKLKFAPFWNPGDYLRELKANGTNTIELEKLYKQHPPEDNFYIYKKRSFDHINRVLFYQNHAQ